jgi:choline dehydrogenase-like flavoprotein
MDADVCIVGAGAAGGLLARELTRDTLRVVVLESGPRHEFSRRAEYVRKYVRGYDPWRHPNPQLDRHTVGGSPPYRLDGKRVRGVGGGTLHWEGYALRLHADDFRMRSRHGIAEDWPISYDDLEPYYTAAEAAFGVAGAADDPWASPRRAPFPLPAFPFSYSDRVFAPACRNVGVALHSLPQARNSVAYGGRSVCRACGTCLVCPTGAKASTDLTHIPAAEATGRVRIESDVSVLRLELGTSGVVDAAVCAGADRKERRVRARVFVLAAGAVENARLLLLSASAEFPTGLANRSGLVGRRFMSHPSIDVVGRAREKTHPYRIGFSTAMSRQFAVDRERSTRGAFLLEFLNSAGPTPERIALASGLSGQALRRHVADEFGHWLGIRVYGEQLPDRANAVSLAGNVRDYFGNRAPHIQCTVGSYERRALDDAKEVATKILRAMGLQDVRATRISYAGHQIGTHRMGNDPQSSVVDPHLRCHDVPNLYLVGSGAFVTASASPPTLTIAALALRAAEHIAARLKQTPGS